MKNLSNLVHFFEPFFNKNCYLITIFLFIFSFNSQHSLAQTTQLQVGKEYEIITPMKIGIWKDYTCTGGWCVCSGSIVKIHLIDKEDQKYVVKIEPGKCMNCGDEKQPDPKFSDELYCINFKKLEDNVRPR